MEKEKKLNRNFKGVWIPKEIYLNKDLNSKEKILLIEIDSLDNGEGCFASNKYLADFLQITEGAIANMLVKLRKKEFIENIKFDGRIRFMKLTDLSKTDLLKKVKPTYSNGQGSSIYNNTINNITDTAVSDNHQNSPHKEVISYFFDRVKDDCGVGPEISGAKDGVAVKRALKKYDFEQIKSIIDFYLDGEKVEKCGYNLSVSLSADTINKWLYEEQRLR